MSKRSLIALVVGLLVLIPLALVGVAVWMGGGDSRIAGAIGATRIDQYERQYGMRLFTDGPGTPQALGPLISATGCSTEANVATAAPGADGVSRKQVSGAVAYGSCRLRVNLYSMQTAFYDLLDDILTRQTGRQGFWIVMSDRTGVPKAAGIHIESALVQLAFSELDGDALDERVELELILRPQAVSEVQNCCSSMSGGAPVGGRSQLFKNKFTVTIANFDGDEDTTKVSGWKATQSASGSTVGLELSDLELTVLRHPDGDFNQWFTDFVTNGQNAAANEKTVTIALLKTDGQPGVTMTFTGVGIRGRESLGLVAEGNAGLVLRDRFTLYA